MHRFQKIFPIAKHPADCGSPSKSKRLYRKNPFKNAESPVTSSPSYQSCSEQESPRTSLLGCDNSNRSFRVDGTGEELEVLCKSLGFSEISDFSIALEEYEELKCRSSPLHDVFPKVHFSDFKQSEDDSVDLVGFPSEIEATRVSDDGCIHETDKAMAIDDVQYEDRIRDDIAGPSVNYTADERLRTGKAKSSRGNDLKGVRPQELVRQPLRALIMADEDSDTWDLSGHAMNSDTDVSRLEIELPVKENEDGIQYAIEEDDMRRRITVNEENPVLSGSCSFTTTSVDDDASSTTSMSNISSTGKCRIVIGDWQKGDLLGHGSVGSVYEGLSDCGLIFAVKQVSLLDQGEEGKQRIVQLQQEIALLSQFEHENIVRYYGTKKDESNLYIFLELVPKGSLLSLYKKYDLRVSQVANYTRQILRGLKYLHDRNIIHRDIKCANILVETNRSVKLADFGLAKVIKLNDVISCKGTAFWMAPEVVRGQGYRLGADIWSLGCTVLEMLTRSFPYSNMERMAALYKIGSGERPPIPNRVSGDARDFIIQCLQVDPTQRPTATQLLNHSFVKRSPSSDALQ